MGRQNIKKIIEVNRDEPDKYRLPAHSAGKRRSAMQS
jgi:hypothetical protein